MDSLVEEGYGFCERLKDWVNGSGVELLSNLLTAAVIFILGWIAIRILAKVLHATLERSQKKALLIHFIVSVVTKTCWAILLVTILSRLGIDVAPIIAGLGVTGFILGFAFQESLGNLASGLMIAVNEPFKVGDYVDAGGHSGTIEEVNMMATIMVTFDNKRVVLPNKSVWGGPIVNYSALATRRVDLQVGIAYGENIENAITVIRGIVEQIPGVLAEPAPDVVVGVLSESRVTINVRPWCKTADYWSVYSATLEAVKEGLAKAKVEIPFPQLVVRQPVVK